MEPLRPRLEEVRQRLGIRWEVLERDYLLSWMLAGIYAVPELGETLVFKGGTALKKCYFGDYRFSEDLDFTGREGVPAGDDMEELMSRACEAAQALAGEYAPVELLCGRYVERNPHPGGQEAFLIRARLPWHQRSDTPVKVEITMDEPILWPRARQAREKQSSSAGSSPKSNHELSRASGNVCMPVPAERFRMPLS